MTEPVSQPQGVQQEEKTFGMLTHLLSLAGMMVPLGNIIGPLIIWLVKKDASKFVDEHGRESVNFQITMTIALFVSLILCFILIGFLLLPAVVIYWIILVIQASLKANEGQPFRYPLTWRVIK
jgi:hypothetical protein